MGARSQGIWSIDAVATPGHGPQTRPHTQTILARESSWPARDIARVVGVDSGLPADLVQGIWEEISPHAEEWRAIGVFPAAVPVPADAPLLDRLLGLTGRDPYAP